MLILKHIKNEKNKFQNTDNAVGSSSNKSNHECQCSKGKWGWGQNSNYGKIFNSKTIATLTGSIVAVERIVPVAKMFYGLHLKVKTGTETISAHLAPTCYLDNQEIQFSKGDKIMVEGSRVSFQNVPAIIATEVEKNDDVLKLRDTNGYPVWSGWRKKGMGKRRNIN